MSRLSEHYGVRPVRLPNLAGLLAEMDEWQVDRSVALQVATKPEQVRPINDWALELLAQPRIVPFGSLHPALPEDELEAEIGRLAVGGVRGIKLQPYFQGYDPLEPASLAMLRRIGSRLVVTLHGGEEMVRVRPLYTTPTDLARLLDLVPEVRLIIAHLGGYERWEEVEAVLAGRDAYFDLSFTLHRCPRDLALRILERHGVDRVVWGSDFPWAHQDWHAVDVLGLSAEEREGLLGGNVSRLLGL